MYSSEFEVKYDVIFEQISFHIIIMAIKIFKTRNSKVDDCDHFNRMMIQYMIIFLNSDVCVYCSDSKC